MVLCGDEEGCLWSWDLVEVRFRIWLASSMVFMKELDCIQATTIGSTPPPKAHEKPILWTAYHPEGSELLTASGDGTVRVWGI